MVVEVVLLLGDREDCGEFGMTTGGGDELSGGDVTRRGIDGIEVAEGEKELVFMVDGEAGRGDGAGRGRTEGTGGELKSE